MQANIRFVQCLRAVCRAVLAQKLTALLRIVNGKAMLLRIKHRMKSKIDLTFLLAKDIGNSVLPEFQDFVNL